MAETDHPVEVVGLGGMGEFGLNMMAISCADTTVLIDAGVMFPDAEYLGVDLIIPDTTYLRQQSRRLSALILTHGHEDHLGAVPYITDLLDGPIYGSPLTLSLLAPKLKEHGLSIESRFVTVKSGDVVSIGLLSVEFIGVTHSIPDSMALAIHTPQGTIVHTADFKIDQAPLDGRQMNIGRLAELGNAGVLALFSDSTNADRPGMSGSELDVVDAFDDIFASTKGRLFVSPFTTSLWRIQILVDIAARFKRKVAFVGRSMLRNVAIAREAGILSIPNGLEVRDSEVEGLPAANTLCLVAGSQGQPMSAMSRIARGDHRHLRLAPEDVVVLSARVIPGNVKAVGRLMDSIARHDVETIHEAVRLVHVSGHGSREELMLMVNLVRPRFFIPIHGEYMQLSRHARLARDVTNGQAEVLIAEDGDRIVFDRRGARLADKVSAGRVCVDGTRSGFVGDQVHRERGHFSTDGMIVVVAGISGDNAMLIRQPDVVGRGLVNDDLTARVLASGPSIVEEAVVAASPRERVDREIITEKIRTRLQQFVRMQTGRLPLIVAIVVQV